MRGFHLHPTPATAVPSDLSGDEGIDHLAAAINDRWDSLDILVNNAGASWGQPLDEFSAQGWDKVMNVNVRGVFFLPSDCCRCFAPRPNLHIPPE